MKTFQSDEEAQVASIEAGVAASNTGIDVKVIGARQGHVVSGDDQAYLQNIRSNLVVPGGVEVKIQGLPGAGVRAAHSERIDAPTAKAPALPQPAAKAVTPKRVTASGLPKGD